MNLVAEAFADPKGSMEEELARLRLQCRRLVKENEDLKLNETRLLAENFQLRNQLYWARNMQTAFHNWLHHKSQGEQVSTAECKTRVQWMGDALNGVTPLMAQQVDSEPVQDVPSSSLVDEAEESRRALILEVLDMVIKRGDKPAVSGENEGQQGELSKVEPAQSQVEDTGSGESPAWVVRLRAQLGIDYREAYRFRPKWLARFETLMEGGSNKRLEEWKAYKNTTLPASDPAPEPVQERVEAAERPQITIIMPGEKDGFDEAHRHEDLEERIAQKIAESDARIYAKLQAEFGSPKASENIIQIGAPRNEKP